MNKPSVVPAPSAAIASNCNTGGAASQSAAAAILRSQRIVIIVRDKPLKEPIMAAAAQTRESGFKANPDYKILFEASPRRVRVKFNGEVIADSTNAHLLFETRHLPVYYFPRSDVRMDRMTPTDHHTFCPYKGTASYWTLAVGDKVAENALWGYPEPFEEVAL
jgi:uncharacterized protein (DUF427 family)